MSGIEFSLYFADSILLYKHDITFPTRASTTSRSGREVELSVGKL